MNPFGAVIAAVALLVSGCATSYQARGLTGGYSETRLAPDVVRVVFNGNGYTGRERTQDMALLRASELSLEAGCPYFAVLNEYNDTRAHAVTAGGTSHTTGSAYSVGNQTYYSAQTTDDPDWTAIIYKPKTGIMVQFLKEKPAEAFAFDAAFLVKTLKEKYRIKP